MSRIDLNIHGMTCASCVSRVEKVLRKQPGVENVSVNLATEKSRIDYDPQLISIPELIKSVERAGYQASQLKAQEKNDLHLPFLIMSSLLSFALVLPMFTNIHLPPLTQFLLALPVQLIAGAKFYVSAWSAIKNRTGNMELLVAIGTTSAFILSLYLWFKGHETHLYFESAAVVITLVLFGKFLEGGAKRKTKASLEALESLLPKLATRLNEDREEQVQISELKRGDTILVRPGEKVAADGEVCSGESETDESLITGEALPVRKSLGDQVVGGSINGSGLLKIKVSKELRDSTLSHIIQMVEDAQAVKAPIQKYVDRVSEVFVPTVLVIAVLTLTVHLFLGYGLEGSLIPAISVLVIACPCALGLATPTCILVGTGAAARMGILIRDPEALEAASEITAVALDKTGTLTEGKPKLDQIMVLSDLKEEDVLRIAVALQRGSEHPLAQAVLNYASERNTTVVHSSELRALPGYGIQGMIEGKKYYLGNERGLEVELPLMNLGGSTRAYLVELEQKKILAAFAFSDSLRSEALETIKELHELGVKVTLLTGDSQAAAQKVADELLIDQLRAEVNPSEKARFVQDQIKSGEKMAMVGDGVNDAPALASAHVGFAMSTGTDVAKQTAGVTLLNGNPMLFPTTIKISRITIRKIKQNLFWAFIYNVIGIPLAAFGYMSPEFAGFAMALSSVSVVLNSTLILSSFRRAVK